MPFHPATLAEPWWKHGVVYNLYPCSYMDGNGDGWGDIAGIRSRLDHLVALGIDAIWMSPVYVSPMKDFGYDVVDHTAVGAQFGTLAEMDALIAEVHGRGMKLMIDFVPNHTSDQHPWFLESRSSRDNPKADWYVWRDPAPDGGPPNNWRSLFGGSAWAWCEERGQYWYHAFLAEQPDLNWRNPAVAAAQHDVMRFWLARGIDGFRVDAMWHLLKDPAWRDNPPNPDFRPGEPAIREFLQIRTADLPETVEVVRGLRRVLDEFPDRAMIGELYLDYERMCAYYGPALDGCHLPFNQHLIMDPWTAEVVARGIETYEAALPKGAWPNWIFGNPDNPRVASRLGPAQARVAAVFLLTARGTPILWQGDELGLENGVVPPEKVRDPQEKQEPGLVDHNRDIARTPMPWDGSRFAGFSTVEPWLPLTEDHASVNVAAEAADPRSMLALHRRLIALRRAHPALAIGDVAVLSGMDDVLAYLRSHGDDRFVVALNLSNLPRAVALPQAVGGRIVLTSGLDREGEVVGGSLRLGADEGVVIALGG